MAGTLPHPRSDEEHGVGVDGCACVAEAPAEIAEADAACAWANISLPMSICTAAINGLSGSYFGTKAATVPPSTGVTVPVT